MASTGEIFEFPIPIEDKELQADGIMQEEKMVHSEFFDGRPLKTPERYLKIRNYILDCWYVAQVTTCYFDQQVNRVLMLIN